MFLSMMMMMMITALVTVIPTPYDYFKQSAPPSPFEVKKINKLLSSIFLQSIKIKKNKKYDTMGNYCLL